MKRYLFVLAALASSLLGSCASLEALPPDELVYQKVIETPGFNKDDLYEKSLKWVAEAFKSSKAVIEYQNKESGEIIGNGIISPTYTYKPVPTEFKLLLEIKDSKIRMTFKSMRFADMGFAFKTKPQLESFSAEAENVVKQLQAYIIKKDSSDW